MDKKNGLIVSWKRTNEIIASIYIVAILAIFPLVFNNYYYDILRVKYMFYYSSVIALFVLILMERLFICMLMPEITSGRTPGM